MRLSATAAAATQTSVAASVARRGAVNASASSSVAVAASVPAAQAYFDGAASMASDTPHALRSVAGPDLA